MAARAGAAAAAGARAGAAAARAGARAGAGLTAKAVAQAAAGAGEAAPCHGRCCRHHSSPGAAATACAANAADAGAAAEQSVSSLDTSAAAAAADGMGTRASTLASEFVTRLCAALCFAASLSPLGGWRSALGGSGGSAGGGGDAAGGEGASAAAALANTAAIDVATRLCAALDLAIARESGTPCLLGTCGAAAPSPGDSVAALTQPERMPPHAQTNMDPGRVFSHSRVERPQPGVVGASVRNTWMWIRGVSTYPTEVAIARTRHLREGDRTRQRMSETLSLSHVCSPRVRSLNGLARVGKLLSCRWPHQCIHVFTSSSPSSPHCPAAAFPPLCAEF